jgi:hypothetical protein
MFVFVQRAQKWNFTKQVSSKNHSTPKFNAWDMKTVPIDCFWLSDSDPGLQLPGKNLREEIATM